MGRLLDRLAERLVRARWPIAGGLFALAVAAGSQLGSLELDPSPEALLDRGGESARNDAELGQYFGRREPPLLAVVEADDVLAPASLGHLHALARFAAAARWARRVDAPTLTPLPHAEPSSEAEEATLDLDALEADSELLDRPAPRGPLAEAVARVVATDPERFPNGLASLAELHDGRALAVGPLADGPTVPAEAGETLASLLAAGHPAALHLVAEDRTLAIVAIELAHDDAATDAAAVHALERWMATHPPPRGASVRLGGLPHVRASLARSLAADRLLLLGLAVLASVAVLAVGFRSATAVALPMAAIGISLAIVLGAVAIAGEPLDLLTNIVPALLVTIGIADAVHIVARAREERARGASGLDAARLTFRSMVVPCFFTSLTTAVGFAALVVSGSPALVRFGVIAAAGTMVVYALLIAFLPAMLAIVPEAPAARPRNGVSSALEGAAERLARLALARPREIFAVTALLVAASLAGASTLDADVGLLDPLDPGSEAVVTTRRLEHALGGVRTFELGVTAEEGSFLDAAGAAGLERALDAIRREGGVLRVTSHLDAIRAAWAGLCRDPRAARDATATDERIEALALLLRAGDATRFDELVTRDGRRARIEVRVTDAGVLQLSALARRIEARASAIPRSHSFIAGEAERSSRALTSLTSDLGGSLGLASALIFVLVAFAFRSARLGLAAIPPNALPLALTSGWMALRDIPLHPATIIVFAVGLGLGVDGSIHVVSRFHEERQPGRPLPEVVVATMRASARGLLLGAGALLVGLGTLLGSGFPPVRVFGELSAVTIVTAVLSNLLLLPAILARFGGRPATTQ